MDYRLQYPGDNDGLSCLCRLNNTGWQLSSAPSSNILLGELGHRTGECIYLWRNLLCFYW